MATRRKYSKRKYTKRKRTVKSRTYKKRGGYISEKGNKRKRKDKLHGDNHDQHSKNKRVIRNAN